MKKLKKCCWTCTYSMMGCYALECWKENLDPEDEHPAVPEDGVCKQWKIAPFLVAETVIEDNEKKYVYEWCGNCKDTREVCRACIRQTLNKNKIMIPEPLDYDPLGDKK